MAEQVIVTIGTDGTATVEVKGCRGPSCSNLTAALEKALGSVVGDVKTPEYLQAGGMIAASQAVKAGQ